MNNLGKENYEIPLHENGEKQRWVDWSSLHPENLHFITDKKALQVLQKRLLSS
jgi:hypothetical protein